MRNPGYTPGFFCFCAQSNRYAIVVAKNLGTETDSDRFKQQFFVFLTATFPQSLFNK
jgi:hypothetical protein